MSITLPEALRLARQAVDAPHPEGYVSEKTYVEREVLRRLVDEVEILSRGCREPAAPVVTLRLTIAAQMMAALVTGSTCHEAKQASELTVGTALKLTNDLFAAAGGPR